MRSNGDDVPRAEDIFLRKNTARRRHSSLPALPGLFDEPLAIVPNPPLPPPPAAAAVPPSAAPLPTRPAPRVWSVGELVRSVRSAVEEQFARVTVEGEISNWRPAASGHCYFTLKDGDAQLAVVMFRREAALLRFMPKDGDAVRLRGQVSIYEVRGQMQLIASGMELAGIGAQLAAVQALKERLKREGLFDRKRPLPAFPRCIGIVTSLQGAALRDIVKVCRRRHAAVQLLIYPAAVQGARCATEVAAGVAWFSAHPGNADVVIVARGGGSWEDLHGFNDELVVRAIAACSLPVVVGVGHATDSVLADAAADVCAPTSSAAAELVTAAQHRVGERVLRAEARLQRAGHFEMLRARQRFFSVPAATALRRMRDGLGRRAQRLDDLEFRTEVATARRLRTAGEMLRTLQLRLERQNLPARLARDQRRLQNALACLAAWAPARLVAERTRINAAESRAEALSPLRVLERGYALVYGPRGELLRSSADVVGYDSITARLATGRLRARVERTESE